MKKHFRIRDGVACQPGLPFVRGSAVGLLCTLLLTLSLAHLVQASPGDLDLTFGTDGTVLTDLFNNGSTDLANAIAIQTDGKIVVAGGSNSGGSFDFALARYNSNGTLDNTFGVIRFGNTIVHSGTVATAFSSNSRDEAFAVALQTDGKIVVAGDSFSGGSDDFALARYNADGTLDTTFGSGGKVITDFGSVSDIALAVVLQPDGKIVVAGGSNVGGNSDFALARYNPNGTLDTTFGSGGKVITDLSGIGIAEEAFAIALQPDGKIVVAGSAGGNFALARYNADGTLDTTFGSGGKLTTDFNSGDDEATAVALQGIKVPKIVVAGTRVGFDLRSDFALARYNSDGSLDAFFGSGGKVTTDLGSASDAARAMTIQVDGKIVVTGTSNVNFALARYNSNGSLDASFGSGGKVITDFGSFSDSGKAIAMQKRDGRIVVAGNSDASGSTDFALARYHAFTCNGFNVSMLGTEESDSLTGTSFPDVINGLRGNDIISGGLGNDIICGDTGDDILEGDDGNDTLNGGLGTDVCSGGSGTNTFLNCEATSVTGPGLAGAWQRLSQSCKPEGQGLQCRLRGTLEVINPGTKTTARSVLQFFLSPDETLDEGDSLLKEVKVGPLEAGETEEVDLKVKLPKEQSAAGQFVIAVLDATNVVPEANEENNIVVSPPVQ